MRKTSIIHSYNSDGTTTIVGSDGQVLLNINHKVSRIDALEAQGFCSCELAIDDLPLAEGSSIFSIEVSNFMSSKERVTDLK